MIPLRMLFLISRKRMPRASGDDPSGVDNKEDRRKYAPRERG